MHHINYVMQCDFVDPDTCHAGHKGLSWSTVIHNNLPAAEHFIPTVETCVILSAEIEHTLLRHA